MLVGLSGLVTCAGELVFGRAFILVIQPVACVGKLVFKRAFI